MANIQTWGVDFIRELQKLHPAMDGIMGLLGNSVKPEYSIVFIMPLLFWNFRRELFFRLFVLMMVDLAIGEVLRALLAQPRPWWIADLFPLDPVTSVYSCPGGYSSFATIFYGYLAIKFRRNWFTLFGIVMITLTGIAKMYDAAMLPLHMIAGIAQGATLVFIFLYYEERLFNWLKNQPTPSLWGLSIAFAAFFFLLDAGALYLQNTYELPVEWAKYKMVPDVRLAEGGIVYACGFLLGALISSRQALRPKSTLSIGWKVAQSIVGLIGVTGLFLAGRLALLSVIDSLVIVAIVNVGLASVTGFWVFTLCPRLFEKLATKA